MNNTYIDDIINMEIENYKKGIINVLLSPYTPSAGKLPNFLAGRDDVINDAKKAILYLINGNAKQPIIYYGLRGVGKTVLLTKVEELAESYDVLCEHIEATERKEFKTYFTLSIQKLIHKLSKFEVAKSAFKKALGTLKAFTAKWSPDGEITFGFDVEALSGVADTGNYVNDFVELFLALGELAKDSSKSICFFIDEIQYMGMHMTQVDKNAKI